MSPANNNLPAPANEEQLTILFKMPLLNYDDEVFDHADRVYDFDDFAEEFMPNMNVAAQLGVWRQIVAGQANDGFYLNPTPPELAAEPPPEPGRKIAGIEMRIRAGFGASAANVPAPLRQAILMLAARWFENRGDAATDATALPVEIAALVNPFRRMRLA